MREQTALSASADAAAGNRLHKDVLAAVRGVVSGGGAALHEPEIAGNEWAYVKDCLDTGWVSTAGSYVERFEGQLVDLTGAAHAVVTVNGTAALHTCLMVAGVAPGDEVIAPALTFVATANAVRHCGAMPNFADVEEASFGLDARRLGAYLERIAESRDSGLVNRETGRRIAAIVCVHVFGHACNLDGLGAVAAAHGLPLIEDAAESIGSYYAGRHTGTFGRLAALSFNGNKIVTTGGGGAVLTDDEELARRARHLTTTAKVPHRWAYEHDAVGYNYRLPNLNAAMGCAQLERLADMLARKRTLAARYADAFARVAGVRFFTEPEGRRSNYWLNALLLDAPDATLRDALLAALNDAGFMSRPVWTPMHRLPMYADCPRDELTQTEALADRVINIPSGAALVA